MFNNCQKLYENIGKYGCLVLCYIHIAEKVLGKEIDAPRAILNLVQLGYVLYDEKDKTGQKILFVKDAEKVLQHLTGRTFSVLKAQGTTGISTADFVITEYTDLRNAFSPTHYSMDDFKPIADSYIEKYGTITGYRLVKILKVGE